MVHATWIDRDSSRAQVLQICFCFSWIGARVYQVSTTSCQGTLRFGLPLSSEEIFLATTSFEGFNYAVNAKQRMIVSGDSDSVLTGSDSSVDEVPVVITYLISWWSLGRRRARIESPGLRAQDIQQYWDHPYYNVMTLDCGLINLIAYDQRARYKTCVPEYRIVTSTALVLSTKPQTLLYNVSVEMCQATWQGSLSSTISLSETN